MRAATAGMAAAVVGTPLSYHPAQAAECLADWRDGGINHVMIGVDQDTIDSEYFRMGRLENAPTGIYIDFMKGEAHLRVPRMAMPFSEECGFFWMFEPQTVEVAVKILDGITANSAIARSSTACTSSSSLACLLGGKFGVEVLRGGWPQPGVAVTDLSASFGFVSAMAPEVVVKVTDSATGEYRTYASPGEFCGGADTAAF